MIVVLPAPFSPTSATRSPGRRTKLRCRTAHRSLPGYWKPTSSKTNPSRTGCGIGGAPGSDLVFGTVAKKSAKSFR